MHKPGRFRMAMLAALLLVFVAAPGAGAASAGARGFLPPNARPLGHSVASLFTAWNRWAFGTAADVNPLLAVRCEQSTVDPRIWFLPVSLGGEWTTTCNVPQGAFLMLMAGGAECSNLEPEPYFGADESDLRSCVAENFDAITYVEVVADGRTTSSLGQYGVTSLLDTLPADNLISTSSGLTMDKGYVLVVPPLSRGTHTFRAYDEFASINFTAGITYTINVH